MILYVQDKSPGACGMGGLGAQTVQDKGTQMEGCSVTLWGGAAART